MNQLVNTCQVYSTSASKVWSLRKPWHGQLQAFGQAMGNLWHLWLPMGNLWLYVEISWNINIWEMNDFIFGRCEGNHTMQNNRPIEGYRWKISAVPGRITIIPLGGPPQKPINRPGLGRAAIGSGLSMDGSKAWCSAMYFCWGYLN